MDVLLFVVIIIAGICVVLVGVVVVCGLYLWVDKRQMRRLVEIPKPSTDWAEEE